MPKLPGVSQKDAVRVFQKLGFKIARESGHIVMSNGEIRLTIPRHNPINSLPWEPSPKTRISHRQNFENYSEHPLGIASLPTSSFTTFVRFADPKIQKLLRDLHL